MSNTTTQPPSELIARLNRGDCVLFVGDTPDGHRRSPETEAQRRMILNWPSGR